MLLKNKKTGEIKPAEAREDGIYLYDEITEQWYKYELDLLAKWWEYYEEPKEYWYMDYGGRIKAINDANDEEDLARKEIGNYFETKEEAELAVEKLKAWKRLKDKGFVFCGTDCVNKNNVIYFEFGGRPLIQSEADEAERELDICFGGEE